jgi:hypothetical protein
MKLARIVRDWRYENDALYRSKYDAESKAFEEKQSSSNAIVFCFAALGIFLGSTILHSILDLDFNIIVAFFGGTIGGAVGLLMGTVVANMATD